MIILKIVLGLILLYECYYRWSVVSFCRKVNKARPHPETTEFALTLAITIAYRVSLVE